MISTSRRLLGVSVVALSIAACGASQVSQPSSSAQPVAAAGSAPCDNAYVPIKVGVTWTYAAKSNTVADFTVVETITNVSADAFTETIDNGGVSQTQLWTCTKDGLVQLADAVYKGPDGTSTVTPKSNTGVTFLRNPKPGDTWTQAMESDVTGSGVTANVKTTSTFKAIGMESVTVPAGTFDALRIDMTTQGVSTFSNQTTMPTTATASIWVVRGKGVVKATSDTGSVTSEIALKNFQIS